MAHFPFLLKTSKQFAEIRRNATPHASFIV